MRSYLRALKRCAALPLVATLFCLPAAHAAGGGKSSSELRPSSTDTLRGPLGLTEVGVLTGAPYRIDIPADWNGSLVVFYHGYSMTNVTFHIAERLGGQQAPFLERHYAVIQSGYSQPGWALPQAYPETEALRRYFVKRYGQPKETYVSGGSMGGALTMVTLELNPKPYMGGLDLCGAVGPTYVSFDRRFAMRAAFDFYFPNVMPSLLNVPDDYIANNAERDKVMAALKKDPKSAEIMRHLLTVHTDTGVASNIAYFTYVVADMIRRSGGNPFDNRNYIYTGTTPGDSHMDYALNDGVKRYAAEPKAREYLLRHYTPSGRLTKPMLAVHTVYDPIIPASTLMLYNQQVELEGFGDNLVQQYVRSEGHCNINGAEELRAFDELVEWVHHGARPQPGLLKLLTPASKEPTKTPLSVPGVKDLPKNQPLQPGVKEPGAAGKQ
ncbi:alpha/beta hydrolase [Granulicella cerasi]|uniref:Alpha/beta hydrolase n=1 Tax=Granulicella cerasi TaxID=741063 RepID=A0ABW1ZCW9_9BACT|nr:alpha/beta hydrolase [Granulicella cerasi]